MTTTKTSNEVKNLTASMKRIVEGEAKVTTKTGNGSSTIIVRTYGSVLPYYVCTNGKGYTVTDGDAVHFLEDAEAVKGYFRSVFDGE